MKIGIFLIIILVTLSLSFSVVFAQALSLDKYPSTIVGITLRGDYSSPTDSEAKKS